MRESKGICNWSWLLGDRHLHDQHICPPSRTAPPPPSVTINPPFYGADTPHSFFDEKLDYGWNLRHLDVSDRVGWSLQV